MAWQLMETNFKVLFFYPINWVFVLVGLILAVMNITFM